MFIAIGKVARMMGVSTTTLRRWDNKGKFSSSFCTLNTNIKITSKNIIVS